MPPTMSPTHDRGRVAISVFWIALWIAGAAWAVHHGRPEGIIPALVVIVLEVHMYRHREH